MMLLDDWQQLDTIVETAFITTVNEPGELRCVVGFAGSKVGPLLVKAADHPRSSMAQDSTHRKDVGRGGDHVASFVPLGCMVAALGRALNAPSASTRGRGRYG